MTTASFLCGAHESEEGNEDTYSKEKDGKEQLPAEFISEIREI
jgi:hypothetical protein